MKIPTPLKQGGRIAVVSLSSGMLGEDFARHDIDLGIKRLKAFGLETVFMPNALKGCEYIKEHPEKRAEDLKTAFLDDSISGIITAIGGDDTFRTIPYLMEDKGFIEAVSERPKLFTGFSDTTNNHLMFHRLGLQTFYGPCFICDLAELADDMLPYTKEAFGNYFKPVNEWVIRPSEYWYEDRTDFSPAAIGTDPVAHREERGFELLQGSPVFSGELLGGCLESLSDMLTGARYAEEKEVISRYRIFPSAEEWRGKILFIETSEEKPSPDEYRTYLESLKAAGVFANISGIIAGKPQDERYYDEYKKILPEVVADSGMPILFNVNIGHASPRTALPYGALCTVDAGSQTITFGQDA